MSDKPSKTDANDRPHRVQVIWTLTVFLGLGLSAITHVSTRGARPAATLAPATAHSPGRYSTPVVQKSPLDSHVDYRAPSSH